MKHVMQNKTTSLDEDLIDILKQFKKELQNVEELQTEQHALT